MGARVELEELAMKALVYQIAEGHTVEDLTEEVRMCPSWPCMHPGACVVGSLGDKEVDDAPCMRLRPAQAAGARSLGHGGGSEGSTGGRRSHALLSQQSPARKGAQARSGRSAC